MTAAHPFGKLLDDIMRTEEITQTELADRLDYSQGWIAAVRTGRKAPTADMAHRISRTFPDYDELQVYLLIKDARVRLGALRSYLEPVAISQLAAA